MKLYFYSNGTECGFARDAASFKREHGKGSLRIGKRIVDTETEIPSGYRPCADDDTAIEPIPTMRNFIHKLTP